MRDLKVGDHVYLVDFLCGCGICERFSNEGGKIIWISDSGDEAEVAPMSAHSTEFYPTENLKKKETLAESKISEEYNI